MGVLRVEKNTNYTTMCNKHLKDMNLSLKAKGLLSIMLSLPDEWHYSVKGLKAICKESINTINGILQELEENGYLLRNRIYCNGKISEWEYVIFESKEKKKLYLENLDIKNEDIENQDIENKDVYKYTKQSSTKELSTKKSNTKGYKETYVSVIDSYTTDEELKQALNDFVEMRKKTKGFTLRALKLNLSALDKLAGDDFTKTQIVNTTVMNGWKSFYPMKQEKVNIPNWYKDVGETKPTEEQLEMIKQMQEKLK